MITLGPKYIKLKTALHLACNRLKILQEKKMELAEKLRKEIANYLQKGKYMNARIKVQRVIREEVSVQAMELIEMFCDQLLTRYSTFQQMKEPDINLVESICSLIWVAPYLQGDVVELKTISKQLAIKYGSNYSRAALTNERGTVCKELIERIKLFMPSDEEINKCLREIAKKYDISYDEKAHIDLRPNKSYYDNNCELESKVESKDQIKSDNYSPHICASIRNMTEGTELCGDGINFIDNSHSSIKAFNSLKLRSINRQRTSKMHTGNENLEVSASNNIPAVTNQPSLLSMPDNKPTVIYYFNHNLSSPDSVSRISFQNQTNIQYENNTPISTDSGSNIIEHFCGTLASPNIKRNQSLDVNLVHENINSPQCQNPSWGYSSLSCGPSSLHDNRDVDQHLRDKDTNISYFASPEKLPKRGKCNAVYDEPPPPYNSAVFNQDPKYYGISESTLEQPLFSPVVPSCPVEVPDENCFDEHVTIASNTELYPTHNL